MSNSWIEYQSTSNLLKKTYMKDFLDVSGEMYVRNGSINIDGNITAGGDLTCKSINLASGALDSGVNSAVQTALDGKQATLTAGTNITISGDTISTSSGGGSNISSVAVDYNDWTIKGEPIHGTVYRDWLGRYVSMSGDGTRMLITVGGGASGSGWNSYVKMYEYSNNAWTQMGSNISNELHYSHDYGGSVMSNDGSTIAICKPQTSTISVFAWDGSAWVQRGGDLVSSSAIQLGVDAALNHDGTVLAGGERKTRHTRWYKWNGTSWDLRGVVEDSDTSTDLLREHGLSLDSTGDRLAFATRAYKNEPTGANGHTRVFDWNESTSTITQIGSDIEGDSLTGDWMQSVSITGDGSTIVIGSTHDEGVGSTVTGPNNAGSVKVYKLISNNWVQQGTTQFGYEANDQMGWSVDINEDGTIITSGSWYSSNARVHVWKWNGSDWQSYGSDILVENYYNGSTTMDTNTETGKTVSISNDGNTIAIGEWRQDTNTTTDTWLEDIGRVRVLQRIPITGIEFDGNVVVEGDLTVSGNVVVSGSTVYTSDDRIKVNEQKIENALENINKLTPQIYDKRESLDVSSNITVCDSGLIAQDIWYKTPELRHLVKVKNSYDIKHMDLDDTINPDPSYNDYGWPNEPAAVNYIASIAYLVSAIQELNSKYEENKTVINNYKASKNV